MTNEQDERRVSETLARVPGVTDVSASATEKIATVTADPSVATEDAMREAIASAGFETRDIRFPE